MLPTVVGSIYWGGVNNTFRSNVVEFHPHACFVGGGDFEDGVDNLFENNTLSVCAFETLDAGGLYVSLACPPLLC